MEADPTSGAAELTEEQELAMATALSLGSDEAMGASTGVPAAAPLAAGAARAAPASPAPAAASPSGGSVPGGVRPPGARTPPPPGGIRAASATLGVGFANPSGSNLCYLNSLLSSFHHTHLRDGITAVRAEHGAAHPHLHGSACAGGSGSSRGSAAAGSGGSGTGGGVCVTCEVGKVLEDFATTDAAVTAAYEMPVRQMGVFDPTLGRKRTPGTVTTRHLALALAAHNADYAIGNMADSEEAYNTILELVHRETMAARGLITVPDTHAHATAVTAAAATGGATAAAAGPAFDSSATLSTEVSAGAVAHDGGDVIMGGGSAATTAAPDVTADAAAAVAAPSMLAAPPGRRCVPYTPSTPLAHVPTSAIDYSCCPAHSLASFGSTTIRLCKLCDGRAAGHTSIDYVRRFNWSQLKAAIEKFGKKVSVPGLGETSIVDQSKAKWAVEWSNSRAAVDLEKTFPPDCPGSVIAHQADCPFAAAAEEQALTDALTTGELTASSTIAEVIAVKERARTNLDFFVRHMTDRNPSVLCISLNYEDQTYDPVEGALRAFRVLELFKEHVNWTHLFPPPVQQGTAAQRTMHSREVTRVAGHAGPAPSAATGGAASAGAAFAGAAAAAATGGAAAGAAASGAAIPPELDWFAWIEDERQRGLSGLPPGLLRTAPAGVYSLRSLVCHVGNHYVAFEHAASLKIQGDLSQGCWKLYNDDVPVVALPDFAAVRNACMEGRWAPGDGKTAALMAMLGMRTPSVINFGMALAPRMMLYEWRDPRVTLDACANEVMRHIGKAALAPAATSPTAATAAGAASAATSDGTTALRGASAMPASAAGTAAEALDAWDALSAEERVRRLQTTAQALAVLRRIIAEPYAAAARRDEGVLAEVGPVIDRFNLSMRRIMNHIPPTPDDDRNVVAGRELACISPTALREYRVYLNTPDVLEAMQSQSVLLVRFLIACGFVLKPHPVALEALRTSMRVEPLDLLFETWVSQPLLIEALIEALVQPSPDLTHTAGTMELPRERTDVWLLASAVRILHATRVPAVEALLDALVASVSASAAAAPASRAAVLESLDLADRALTHRLDRQDAEGRVIAAAKHQHLKSDNPKIASMLTTLPGLTQLFAALGFLPVDPARPHDWILSDAAFCHDLLTLARGRLRALAVELRASPTLPSAAA